MIDRSALRREAWSQAFAILDAAFQQGFDCAQAAGEDPESPEGRYLNRCFLEILGSVDNHTTRPKRRLGVRHIRRRP